MDLQKALEILDDHASTHGSDRGYYAADFSIKVYPETPTDLEPHQQQYLENSFWDTCQFELEYLIESIKQDVYPPTEIEQTGRSGGWLKCYWNSPIPPEYLEYTIDETDDDFEPETATDIIELAETVRRIALQIKQAVQYFESREYWVDQLEANAPSKAQWLASLYNRFVFGNGWGDTPVEHVLIAPGSAYPWIDQDQELRLVP